MSGNKIDLYVSGPPEIDLSVEQTSSAMMAKDVLALKNRMTDMEQQHKTDITKIQEDKAEKGSTLSEYGIKDAYTKTETDSKISDVKDDVETNYYDKEDIDTKLLQRDDNLQNAIDTYDGRLNGIDEQISEMDSEIADVKAIAKGRATGYVFDTLEDLDAWLSDETNTANLVLGDNFYIRAVDVPDYWWDGSAKQQLETQKVDLTEYVKNTDYATKEKAGVVRVATVSHSGNGIRMHNGELLAIDPALKSDIVQKLSYNMPITPICADYVVQYATHQTMADDYDTTTLSVISGLLGAQGTLPASYEAVKGYVDTSIQQAILDSWEVAV